MSCRVAEFQATPRWLRLAGLLYICQSHCWRFAAFSDYISQTAAISSFVGNDVKKPSLLETVIGLCSAAVLVISGMVLAQLFHQAATLGSHTEKLENLEKLDARIADAERSILARFDQSDQALATMQRSLNFTQADPTKILVQMGVVREGQVFSAAVHNGAVYVIPGNQTVVDQIEATGLKRVPLNSGVSGYRIYELRMAPNGVAPRVRKGVIEQER